MSDFYVDFVNGSASNGGTSWSDAFASLTSITAALITAGDTIKIAKTPTDLVAEDCTWTEGDVDSYIDIPTAYTHTLVPKGATWTCSTNVTQSSSTSYTLAKGPYFGFTFASGFTTGKAAYYTLGSTLDASAYQQLMLWATNFNTTYAAGTIQIALCADTTGDTVVNTFSLGAIYAAGISLNWRQYLIDNGAALGSTINSIAIYVTIDPGASTLYITLPCLALASTDPNCLTLKHVICKDNLAPSQVYAIGQIDGTRIYIMANCGRSTGITMSGKSAYREGSGIGDLYKIAPVDLSVNHTLALATGYPGTPITFSFGWDTSADTQDGITALDQSYDYYFQVGPSSTTRNIMISNLLWVRSLLVSQIPPQAIITSCAMIDCNALVFNNKSLGCRFINFYMRGGGYSSTGTLSGWLWSNGVINDVEFNNCIFSGLSSMAPVGLTGFAYNSPGRTAISCNLTFRNTTFYGHRWLIELQQEMDIKFINCDLSSSFYYNNSYAIVYPVGSGQVLFKNCKFGEHNYLIYNWVTQLWACSRLVVKSLNHNQVSGRHLTVITNPPTLDGVGYQNLRLGSIGDHITLGQTESWGYNSQLSCVMSADNNRYPITQQFLIPVTAGVETSIALVVRKDSASSDCTLSCTVKDSALTGDTLVDAQAITLTTDWVSNSITSFTSTSTGYVVLECSVTRGTIVGHVGIGQITVSPQSRFKVGVMNDISRDLIETQVPIIYTAKVQNNVITG